MLAEGPWGQVRTLGLTLNVTVSPQRAGWCVLSSAVWREADRRGEESR